MATLAELQDDIDGLEIDFAKGRIWSPKYGDLTLMVIAEREELKKQQRYDAALAQIEIAAASSKANGLLPFKFGRTVAQVDEQDFAEQEKLEPGCWKDPNFVKDFVKHNPAAKAPERKNESKVGYLPTKDTKGD